MASSDAEDASPSPEYSGDDHEDMAAEQANDRDSTGGSPDQKKGNTKSNAKDPLRPRRKKARRACFACQRAHLTCGEYFLVPGHFSLSKVKGLKLLSLPH